MTETKTQAISRRRSPAGPRGGPPEASARSKTLGPNWLAEMLAGPGRHLGDEAAVWQPTHRRNESLTSPGDFLIYDGRANASAKPTQRQREPATLCDRASAVGARHFYLLNKSNSESDTESSQHKSAVESTDSSDHEIARQHPGAAPICKRLGARPKFKLRWLLAKSLGSLGVTCAPAAPIQLLLLLGCLVATCQPAQQTLASALVIKVQSKQLAPGPPPPQPVARQHQHQRRPRGLSPNYVIVSSPPAALNSSSAGGQRAKRASEQKLERSAELLETDALNYLHRYGYMNSSTSTSSAINLISEESFHEAVMQFQRFAGIPETGAVDGLTVQFMQMPRCGNKDLGGKGENGKRKRRRRKRRKRYALQGSKWRRQELSYRISQYPSRFSSKRHEVDSQIERAFRIWSQVAPIDFVVKREGRVHIDIRFASGDHDDGDPFDGPGNTLAHAYFPQYGGDAHFDDQEYWTVDSYAGTNIFQVAAHELGHSLGLGHSSVREALMAPFYQKYKPNFKLHVDDVLAIQALYGERGGGVADDSADDSPKQAAPSTSTTTEGSVPRRRPSEPDDGGGSPGPAGAKPVDLCQDTRVDAITRTEDGSTYVFRGQHYWQIKNEGLAGPAGKIARDWDGLPANLDAALTWSDGKTFFFKGEKYWRYLNKRREPGYPKLISVGFAGIPNNLDAAFVWSGNGKTYFFKRDKYWRFDSKQEPPVSGQYPKPLKNWVGLPAGGVDAAFKWDNGMTYFFKDELYYRFDDREFEVDAAARPAFPRSTAEWWFGCTNSNLPFLRRPDDDTAPGWPRPPADIEPSESSQQPGAALATGSLLFHRRPSLAYETSAPAAASSASGRGSISRSIISSLSALFPASDGSSALASPSTSTSALGAAGRSANPRQLDDWSFHRGLGEEVRRLMKGGRSLADGRGSSPSSSAPADKDNARWSFPLGSRQSGGDSRHQAASHGGRDQAAAGRAGEQSLSELRLEPPSHNSSSPSAPVGNRETAAGEDAAGGASPVVTRAPNRAAR